MEVAAILATEAVAILAPALGRLLKRGGEKAADKAGEQLGAEAWTLAQKVWKQIGPRATASRPVLAAATDVADHPDDADLQAVLRVELRKLLAEDPRLQDRLAQVINETTTTTINASGERITAAGRDITGSTIVYGDYKRSEAVDDGGVEAFRHASGALRAAMIFGGVLILGGFALFIYPIVSTFTQDTNSFEGPDLAPAAIGFVLLFAGIVVSGVATFLAKLNQNGR